MVKGGGGKMSKTVRTSVEIENFDVVKQYAISIGKTLKDLINGLIAEGITRSNSEEFIVKYFKKV